MIHKDGDNVVSGVMACVVDSHYTTCASYEYIKDNR